eukprot:TRINITY_DN8661_c0_g2_i1.p1 TRINITY_DN8661_c0_g2~~TRINITY_DN8661_c0_g2_i1.p1  ORF type:complete len:868 (+),score=290.49 TRINITY_DN8661_c0_g2_i1:121-2724(+)
MDPFDADAEVATVNVFNQTHAGGGGSGKTSTPCPIPPRPGTSSGGGLRLSYLSSRFPKRCGTSTSDRRTRRGGGRRLPASPDEADGDDADPAVPHRPRAGSAVSGAAPEPRAPPPGGRSATPHRLYDSHWSRDTVWTPETEGGVAGSRAACRTPFSATGEEDGGLGGLNDLLTTDYLYQQELFSGARAKRELMKEQLAEKAKAFEAKEEAARVGLRLDEGAARSKLFVHIAGEAAKAKKAHRQWLREQRRTRGRNRPQPAAPEPGVDAPSFFSDHLRKQSGAAFITNAAGAGGLLALEPGSPGVDCRSRSGSAVSVGSAPDQPIAEDPLVDFHDQIYDFDFLDAFTKDHAHLVLAEAPWDRDGPMGSSYLRLEKQYADLYAMLSNAPRQQMARSFWAEQVVRENATAGCTLRGVLRDDLVKYKREQAVAAILAEEADIRGKLEAVATFVHDHLQQGLQEVLLGTLMRAQVAAVAEEAAARAELIRLEVEDRSAYGKWREIRGLVAAEEDVRISVQDEEKIDRSCIFDTEQAEKPSSVRLHVACGPDEPICTVCGFALTVRFCGVNGEPHAVSGRCETCGLLRAGNPFCPATGEPHERMYEWDTRTPKDRQPTTLFRSTGQALCARPMRAEMYREFLAGEPELTMDDLTGEFLHMLAPKMVMELCHQLAGAKGYSLAACDQIYTLALDEMGVDYDEALLPSMIAEDLPSSEEEEVAPPSQRRGDRGGAAASVAGRSARSKHSRGGSRRKRGTSMSGSSAADPDQSEFSSDADDNKSRKQSLHQARSWKKQSIAGGRGGSKKSIVGMNTPKKSIVGTPKKSIIGDMRSKKSIVGRESPTNADSRRSIGGGALSRAESKKSIVRSHNRDD